MGVDKLFRDDFVQQWNGIEIRFLIFLSLLLQIILILFGARRKYTSTNWIRILVGSAYMMLHSVVTVSLGHISNNQADSSKNFSSVPKDKLQEFGHHSFLCIWEALTLSQHMPWKTMTSPDPCSDFIKHVEKDHSFKGDRDHQDQLMEEGSSSSSSVLSVMVLPQDGIDDPKDHRLVEAYFMFKRLEYLFVGLVLDYYERIGIYSIKRDKSAEDSFKLVAIELGFMYDTLYTKATIVCSRFGIVFRCISFFSSVSAVVVFSVMNLLFHRYSKTDIFLTYSLLAGAVFVEVYAIMVLFYSDWTRLWLIKCKKAQHNLVSKFLVDHLWRFTSPSHSLELIFNQLKKKGDILIDINVSYVVLRNEFLAHRGDHALKIQQHLGDRFHWSTTEVDFDLSLLIWHIATDGIGEIRYKETCTEAMEFFKKRRNVRLPSKKCDAFKELLHDDTLKDLLSRSEREAKGPCSRRRNQSVLYQGCKLAKQFLELGTQSSSFSDEDGSASKENWEIISEVWVEMLAYAAHRCGWKAHCEQLRNGGELLTHVCLLMVHLGLSKQFVFTI
ncbi:hypothetical protein Q3G72_006644 [Acer saccharum]|nr:hypothetical protein Q3G72_006644 [Acer saccharum]